MLGSHEKRGWMRTTAATAANEELLFSVHYRKLLIAQVYCRHQETERDIYLL